MPSRKCLPHVTLDIITILILLALIVVMALVIWKTPKVPTESAYLVTAVTAIATVVSSIVTGRVQHGFIRRLEKPLLDSANAPNVPEPLDIKWRGVLRIDGVKEKLTNWRIFIIYLLCGLLTPAIVTTFTPAPGVQEIYYQPFIPGNVPPVTLDGKSDACAGIDVKGEGVQGAYSWQMGNGSRFFSKYEGDCPAMRMTALVSNINNVDVDNYVYVDSGVAVHRTAIGASAHLFRGSAFRSLADRKGRSLRSTSQCVLVMTKNPVSCEVGGGSLERIEDKKLKLVMDDNRLSRVVEFSSRNLTESSVMINYVWAVGEVGSAVVVYSAYNDPNGTTAFTRDLARAVNDSSQDARSGGGESYMVTCTLNARESFEYRLVTLSLQAAGETNRTNIAYNRVLWGDGPCKPEKETVSDLYYVAAATAQYPMAMENFGKDGYFSTINRVVGTNRSRAFAFNESSYNALEDVLGVIAAQGVSTMDLLNNAVEARPLGGSAAARIDIKRFGSGDRWALLLIVSPMIPLGFLCWFVYCSRQAAYQPGGGNGKRPEFYLAESTIELRKLGTSANSD